MKIVYPLPFLIISLFIVSCNSEGDELLYVSSSITELSDTQYPDNNDMESRSELWDKYDHSLF